MDNQAVGAKTCHPNPALQFLAFMIGEWSTSGTHPAMPGEELPGTTSFQWGDDGAFLVMRSQTDHNDFPMVSLSSRATMTRGETYRSGHRPVLAA